jgi:hypothetical protein
MVRRLCTGLVGELASRKARNLEQGGVSGDGGASDPADDTLKAIGHREFFRSRGREDGAGKRHEWRTRGTGSTAGSEDLREGETEEGSGRREGLNPDPEERVGPRSNASKSSGPRVAAGSPVSARTVTARGHELVTSQRGRGAGETPER